MAGLVFGGLPLILREKMKNGQERKAKGSHTAKRPSVNDRQLPLVTVTALPAISALHPSALHGGWLEKSRFPV